LKIHNKARFNLWSNNFVQYQSYVENPFWSKYDKDDGVGEYPFADDSKNYATGDSIFHDFWLRLSYKSKLGQQLPHDNKPKK
jgi:hypothetical protein